MSINISELIKENPLSATTERPRRGKKKTSILRQSQGYKNSKNRLKCDPNTSPKGNDKVTALGSMIDINRLSGNESKILNFLFQNGYNRGKRITGQITLSGITETLKISSRNVTTRTRLAKKGFITRKGGKRGNGGFGIYEIPKDIYQELIMHKVTIREPLGSHKVSHGITDRVTSSPSSSINNTITTKKDGNWLQDIQTPENLKTLGLGVNHVKQLKDKFSLSSEEIQQGLEAFSYDLSNGELERLKKRGIQNIIGYFFGAMKNGGYNSVKEDFITAEDLAEKEMLERLEKIKNERINRKNKIEELLFNEWLETKSKEELTKIEPPLTNYMDTFHRTTLKQYFLNNEMVEFNKGFQ